jgi:SAM-dependent methyltransferase
MMMTRQADLHDRNAADRPQCGTAGRAFTLDERLATGHLGGGWLEVDKASDPGFFVRFLDASRTRALELARRNPALAFAHLALEPGLSVLDCGCGTGDMLAIIAALIAPGEAQGGDLSNAMLDEARRRAATTGATNLRFRSMDVQSLPFPDRSFDRVLATQLLVHVPDARRAMHELCRVTAQDGRIAVADMDWDSLVLGCSDRELGRRFTRLFCDGIRNGLVVREHAGWMRAEGFAQVQIAAQPMVFDEWTFVREWILEPSLPYFVAQGAMSAAEAGALVDDLESRNANGSFFAAATHYTATGRRA